MESGRFQETLESLKGFFHHIFRFNRGLVSISAVAAFSKPFSARYILDFKNNVSTFHDSSWVRVVNRNPSLSFIEIWKVCNEYAVDMTKVHLHLRRSMRLRTCHFTYPGHHNARLYQFSFWTFLPLFLNYRFFSVGLAIHQNV